MNGQGAQQQKSPSQEQQQQHEERAMLSQLQEIHGVQPGTCQATINDELPADALPNTNTDITLNRPYFGYEWLAQHPFGCDLAAPDHFGVVSSFAELPSEQNISQFSRFDSNFNSTSVLADASGLLLGGANDFPPSAGPYELPVAPTQDGTLTVPIENIQPQLNFVTSAQTLNFSQPNTISNPFPRNSGLRNPNLPKLTLHPENIFPRLSWQGNRSSSVPSQFTGSTISSRSSITPFSPTEVSSGTGTTPFSLPEEEVPYKKSDDIVLTHESLSMRDIEGLEDLFTDPRPTLSLTMNDNVQIAPVSQSDPPGLVPRSFHPHSSQLSVPPAPPAPPAILTLPSSYDNMCPRCHHPITGKPRDLSRNIRRHLSLSCPKRDTVAPRLPCEALGCKKTFAREAAKRVHEEKQHGIVRSGRRRAGKSAIESRSTTNATRVKPVYQDEQTQAASRMYQAEDSDDTTEVPTEGMELDLPWSTTRYLIQQFAEELLIAIPPTAVSTESLDRIFKLLPDLLRQYAIPLTKEEQPRIEQNAVTFVRQNPAYIAAALHEKWRQYQDTTRRKLFPNEGLAELSSKERVNQWNNAGSPDTSQPEETFKYSPDGYDEDEASTSPYLSLYKPYLLEGEAYKWLVSRLRKEFLLARPEAFAMKQIREAILQHFPQSEKARMTFHLDWNLSAFFEEQGFKGNFPDEIPRTITITGSSHSAQATSFERYLLDTWPTTGALTLIALQHAISGRKDDTPADLFQDSNLRILLRETHTEVEIMGDKHFITDVGEQLGWMGAALRSSAIDGRMCYCVPSVSYSDSIFNIDYTSEPVPATETILNGNCWHPLFNNPAIVRGFPIAMRYTGTPEEELPGLEIPLNMMAEIAEAKRVTEIDGRLLIKGFSTLFVPTKIVDDLVIWHMIYNEDDSRISYFDLRGVDISDTSVGGLTFSVLESARHILGWCSVANTLAGSKDAKYDIKPSRLRQPGNGLTFEKVTIGGGQFVNGGISIGKGNINTPLHLRRQPVYVKQMFEARSKYVILHDVEDKRAWLLNGADAILHLARAYLIFASKEPVLKDKIKLSSEDLRVPINEYDACAPFEILCDDRNKDLIIYEDSKTTQERAIDSKGNVTEVTKVQEAHFRFRDQVDEIYHIWEQIQDFQTKMTDNIRLTDRDKLQGFDFMDVATGGSPIRPRFTYLKPSGRGWVDLVRSLDAITLFGCGFGELLQPSSESNEICHSWRHVPIGKDYLAVSMSDVRAIFDKRGNVTNRGTELVDGLSWHKADKLFEPCECAATGARKGRSIFRRGTMCDRVQVLLPRSLGRKIDPGPLEKMETKGAVIFGKSEKYCWQYPNQGQPNEATGLDEDSENDRPQKKARSSPSSQVSQVSEIFSGDTQQTPATTVSEDASSSPRTESPVKR